MTFCKRLTAAEPLMRSRLYVPKRQPWSVSHAFNLFLRFNECINSILLYTDATHIEKSILENYGSDATIIPGARDARQSQRLVPALGHCHVRLATLAQRLGPGPRPAHLPAPRHRQSVEDGKPDPAGYLLGMKKLAIKDPAGCAVFEDRPAGIRAGKTAGCKVVALATSHTAEQVAEANPDRVVDDFSSVALV